MNRSYKYLAAVLLAAMVAGPMTGFSAGGPQESRRQEQNEKNRQNARMYDREHKDYHNWDTEEDRNYRAYLGERHRDYREFSRQNRKQQNEYWKWRHEHSNDNRGGDRDRR